MNAEQITTIITNVLTGSGVIFFVGMVIRGLRTRIEEMNKTIEVQQQTLKAMETRVLETEKIGNIYRQLFETLPAEVEKWKVAILKLKDERIEELEKANQNRDGKLTGVVNVEAEKILEIIDNMEQEMSDLVLYDDPALRSWISKGKSLETMMKNERIIALHLSAYPEKDRTIALAVWSFLDAESKPTTLKEIASKLKLNNMTVRNALDQLIDKGCVEYPGFNTDKLTTYTAVIPHQ